MTDGGLPPPDGVKKQMKGYKSSILFLEGALVEMCSTLSAFISYYLIGIGGHDCGFEKVENLGTAMSAIPFIISLNCTRDRIAQL